MIRIGDFSRLAMVTVKALRHYDSLGLFMPVFVDEESGYRYYSAAQLPKLHRVLALKDAGFSLEEIKGLMARRASTEEICAMLRRKQSEISQHIREEQQRLDRLAARLDLWEREPNMPDYEVIIKRVEPILVAGIHETIPNREAVGPTFNRIFDEVFAYAAQNGAVITGAAMDLWFDTEHKEENMEVEACAPIAKPIPETDRVKVHTLPALESVASAIHQGPFTLLPSAFDAVLRWIDANGYTVNGPCREIYLEFDPKGNPEAWVTEIQLPVEKV